MRECGMFFSHTRGEHNNRVAPCRDAGAQPRFRCPLNKRLPCCARTQPGNRDPDNERLPSPCHRLAIPLPSPCHPLAIPLPSPCHRLAIVLPSSCHTLAVPLPSSCHPLIVFLPPPWRRSAVRQAGACHTARTSRGAASHGGTFCTATHAALRSLPKAFARASSSGFTAGRARPSGSVWAKTGTRSCSSFLLSLGRCTP